MLESIKDQVPEKVLRVIQGISIQNPETLAYLLTLLVTRYGTVSIPFDALDRVDGEGALMCGIDTTHGQLHLSFMAGSKDQVVDAMQALRAGKQLEVVDPQELFEGQTN